MTHSAAARRERRLARYASRVDDDGRLVALGVVHGSYSTYSNHGCRCGGCTTAWRAAIKARRDERIRKFLAEVDGRMVTMAEVRHGKIGTYQNWGCRCLPCTEDARRVKAQQRRRTA